MNDRADLEVQTQVRFTEDGLEADSEVSTDLEDWGVHECGQERETKIEVGGSSEFADDRDRRGEVDAGEQETLVADVAQDQVTLGGEQAATQSKW